MRFAVVIAALVVGCTSPLPIFDDAATFDAGPDDAGPDDAGVDAGFDAFVPPVDGGVDAGFDGGVDAGFDGGIDAGSDAGFDAGSDAGCTDQFLECTGTFGDCETWGWADEANCGSCGRACLVDQRCVAGDCAGPVIAEVALGTNHTCVLLTSGHVVCFGRDHRAQLGDGSFDVGGLEDRFGPAAVVMLDNAVDIAADGLLTCVIRGSERSVWCWGGNNPRQFGPPTTSLSIYSAPEMLRFDITPQPAREISLSGGHICVRTDTRVLCSGSNPGERLGRTGSASEQLSEVMGLPAGTPRSIAAGGTGSFGFTCVVMSDGVVYCFGNNGDGECGQLPGTGMVSPPMAVPTVTNAVRVVAGNRFACALDDMGAVYCWGDNASGATGNGSVGGPDQAPALVAGLPAIGAIAAGVTTVFATNVAGDEIWAWGEAGAGQLGLGAGMLADRGTPVRLFAVGGTVHDAFIASTHSCYVARRSGVNPTLSCSGSNAYGQLGVATPAVTHTFVPVPFFP